jgi:phosphoribosylanthranilate isomerase
MPTRVKICGITRGEDADLAVELGAAALGFNFYPRSPRFLAPKLAREIIRGLPPFVMAVGVFADEADAGRIAAVAQEAGVGTLQLHGPKFPPADTLGSYPVIRAVTIGEEENEDLPEEVVKGVQSERRATAFFEACFLSQLNVRAILLDTADPLLRGGTGRTFDWKRARAFGRLGRVILAGGLTPENVFEAIKEVRPYAVDVASGVECSPGLKDPAKLRAFFAAVEDADRKLESITR